MNFGMLNDIHGNTLIENIQLPLDHLISWSTEENLFKSSHIFDTI